MARIKIKKSYEKEGFSKPVFEYRADWPYISIGFGDERDYFIENLSLLISSGMGISAALSSLRLSVKTRKMKKIVAVIEELVNSGFPVWKAFAETKLVPDRIVSLIQAGESAGRLADHLNLVTLQQNKEKIFRSRLRSALLYPGIILSLALVVAIGSAWFILPEFVGMFTELDATLPFTTQILITIGTFLQHHGLWAVPATIILFSGLVYVIFFHKKTKFIGDSILFSTPGVKNLAQGIELARFGYIAGTLLQAGLQVGEVFEIVERGSNYRAYRRLYRDFRERVLRGESFREAISEYRKVDKYIPIPIQQLIMSAEKSGKLPETFIRIGIIFEEKTEAMARDLSTILEPIILIVVGLLVAFIVTAIIGPIYELSGQF